ncbi:MAG TPA: DNA methyltransferase [Rhizomicrobium sp.]|nr:DNA methyltransferase [Rhizomicrobium sp.]
MGNLYYGDNLEILRNEIASESVDLIYLDPPFNSNANYNVLFKAPDGHESHAQMEAFEDTWHWNETAERAFDEVIQSGNSDAAEMLRAMRSFLGTNDMMAYLTMMAVRLLELHRVLKPTGSLYLHCDPTASHYLKILLDAIFGKEFFENEIVWLRTNSHNMRTRTWVRQNDTILYYTKTARFTFNAQYTEYGEAQLGRFKPDEDGRLYKAENLTFSTANPARQFVWRGSVPPKNRSWGADKEQLEKWYSEGRILLKRDGSPRLDGLKVYLDETKGKLCGTNWTDISRVGNTSGERLGYPTQKPLALLERIINASSNEGDIVLDPFCGCGTTVHAAQKLNRKWIGIDVTHLAISLIQKRLRDAFPDVTIEVHGTPKDVGGAEALAAQDKYQFQWWAVSLVDAVPFGGKKKGADGGIDGYIYFKPDGKVTEKAVVSVKGGDNVGVGMIRDLIATVDRDKAKMGVLISLAPPTGPMIKEAASAGLYKTDHGEFPKIQILTIEQLFGGHKPKMPWVDTTAFKKAKREMKGTQGTLL